MKPRGLLRRGFKLEALPLLGVFALDSPTRPNRIGLTLVCVVKGEGNRLFVQGLDFFDGTPILDIKGYRPQYRLKIAPRRIGFESWPMTTVTSGQHVDFRRTANLSFVFPNSGKIPQLIAEIIVP